MTIGSIDQLGGDLEARGLQVEEVLGRIAAFTVELPSWGFGDSGTRFKVFPWPGAARTIDEKLQDASLVNRLTGMCPAVAIHIPWDSVDDWEGLRQRAADLGLRIGAVNPNLFQEDDYRLGSVCNPDAGIRQRAVEHMVECIGIARRVGSRTLSLWLADGTNYAGQDDFRARKRRMLDALAEVYHSLDSGMRLLIEYKPFEPAFYHTDLADWGMACVLASRLGPQAKVLVDTGHHAPGTNLEHLVAFLLDEQMLGGFHFNSRRYADDDLIVGSVNPFELVLIFNELAAAEDDHTTREGVREIAYMIDQSHNIESKVEAMIQSVINVQTAFAKALTVDRRSLRAARESGDVLEAHRVLVQAAETDVRPLLEQVRRGRGLVPNPIQAFRAGGYTDRVARERGVTRAQGGYPGGGPPAH